jgi:AraC-like DNA-binding protein/effector-binding domain-containing protein
MQPVLVYAAAHLDDDISLTALASQAALSPFHLHRVFAAAVGETSKQYTLRLRLGRAAALLLTSGDSVLDVALSCGFQSHEVFCRAFRRQFGTTPSAYRARGFVNSVSTARAREHAAVVNIIGPCVGLYHVSGEIEPEGNDMTYSITKKELSLQPVLVVRRRVKRSAIAATIAEVLPNIFLYAQKNGIALTGLPFTRYVEVGPGLLTIEPGMRIASSPIARIQASGDAEIVSDTLPDGLAATTTHIGPYDKPFGRLRRHSTMDRSGRSRRRGRALGVLRHRSSRVSRSKGLEDRRVLATCTLAGPLPIYPYFSLW